MMIPCVWCKSNDVRRKRHKHSYRCINRNTSLAFCCIFVSPMQELNPIDFLFFEQPTKTNKKIKKSVSLRAAIYTCSIKDAKTKQIRKLFFFSFSWWFCPRTSPSHCPPMVGTLITMGLVKGEELLSRNGRTATLS